MGIVIRAGRQERTSFVKLYFEQRKSAIETSRFGRLHFRVLPRVIKCISLPVWEVGQLSAASFFQSFRGSPWQIQFELVLQEQVSQLDFT